MSDYKTETLVEMLKKAIDDDDALLADFVPRETIEARLNVAWQMLALYDPSLVPAPAAKVRAAPQPRCLCGKAYSQHRKVKGGDNDILWCPGQRGLVSYKPVTP